MRFLAEILGMAGRSVFMAQWVLENLPPIVDQLSALAIFFS